MPTIKLSQYAKENSVTWRTAFRWYQEGKIPNARKTPGGSIVIDMDEDTPSNDQEPITITYARVSNSSRRKTDLERQSERLARFCSNQGWEVHHAYKEVGSGLNDNRTKLLAMITRKEKMRIVVEHKDRLTRFGFNYLKVLLEKDGNEIIVINTNEDDKDDLVEDFVSVITSFCARIYGQRKSKRKTEQLLGVVHET